MAAPDFSMDNWSTGSPVTLMQALGYSKTTLTFPQLTPELPNASAQYSLPGSSSPVKKGPLVQYAKKLITSMGDTGQFADLNNIIVAESNWNSHIKNPSGAYGIAQALGHGNSSTQGTESNAYGGYGLSDKEAKSANSGDGYWQLVWMINYCNTKYGSVAKAWTFHKANGWY